MRVVPPALGSYWRARRSGKLYRAVTHVVHVSEAGTQQGAGIVLLPHEQGESAASLALPLTILQTLLEEAPDPHGPWPFHPSRWRVEQLHGQHGIRGIVGHDILREFGWRSIDERATELHLPTWITVVTSVGMGMRTYWKTHYITDPIMFNVPKTNSKHGNHQKVMYPNGVFQTLDMLLHRRVAYIRASVPGSEHMNDAEVEAAWVQQKRGSEGPTEEERRQFSAQRSVDRARTRTWVKAAEEEEGP